MKPMKSKCHLSSVQLKNKTKQHSVKEWALFNKQYWIHNHYFEMSQTEARICLGSCQNSHIHKSKTVRLGRQI